MDTTGTCLAIRLACQFEGERDSKPSLTTARSARSVGVCDTVLKLTSGEKQETDRETGIQTETEGQTETETERDRDTGRLERE